MSLWQGYTVLPVEPSRDGAIPETITRGARLFENPTGVQGVRVHTAAPAPARAFTWYASGDQAIVELEAFLDDRRGIVVPFWVPSYQADLVLAQDAAPGTSTIQIRWAGYTSRLFPSSGRRDLALFLPDGTPEFHRVTDAAAPVAYQPETLTVSPVTTREHPMARTLVSFLKFVRLDEDETEIVWETRAVARATIRVRELPFEVPA